MVCFKSMLARRLTLWYILLGSFVILPLTFNVGMGCRFLNVIYSNGEDVQSFGAYNVAIYDPEAKGDDHFLGCVNLSLFWQEHTDNDYGFTTLRISSIWMMLFTTLATAICLLLQCFSKSGKTHLWAIMRVCYIGALLGQGCMYSVFASNLCTTDTNDHDSSGMYVSSGSPKCLPGQSGMLGIFNFVLLLLMVIATFNSLPPRNPVFQCWGADSELDDDESEDGSTSEEDSVMRAFKSLGGADGDESVSLFEGSRVSRRSRRAVISAVKSVDDAEKGLANSVASGAKSPKSIPSKYEKYAIAEEQEEGSVKSSKSAASKASKRSSSARIAVETVVSGSDCTSVSSNKSSNKNKIKLLPGVTKYLSKSGSGSPKKVKKASSTFEAVEEKGSDEKSVRSVLPENPDINATGSLLGYGMNTMSDSINSVATGSTLEVANFVVQLIGMTELREGGRRIKMKDTENQVEIIDEYPSITDGQIRSSPSSDIAAVRTEYYNLGSRSVKEIKHKDGSTTVITTIIVDNGSDNSTLGSVVEEHQKFEGKRQQPIDPPLETKFSAGSIASHSSSKYQVDYAVSSTDDDSESYRGGTTKDEMKQGDLCLSLGTTSKKGQC